jgi:hypothetical protein
MTRLLLAASAVSTMLVGTVSSEAAQFSPHKDGAILLDGEIAKGDIKRLYDAVTA